MLYISSENGQGLTEYAFILVLVAFLLIGLLTVFGQQIINTYQNILDEIVAI
jgi:Flp pilus assembly pilin Flp